MDYAVHGVVKSWTRLSNFHFTQEIQSQMEHVLKDRGKKSFACNPPIQFLTVKQIIKLLILIFIYFLLGYAGALFLRGLFSSCSQQGLLSSCADRLVTGVASRAEHGLKGAWAQQLQCMGSVAVVQFLQGMWDPPGPGIEPDFPALGGGLFTTQPPALKLLF